MWVLQAPYQGSIIEICLNWGYEYVSTFINVLSFKCKICNQLIMNTILEEKTTTGVQESCSYHFTIKLKTTSISF